jgi:hypothetical protein
MKRLVSVDGVFSENFASSAAEKWIRRALISSR